MGKNKALAKERAEKQARRDNDRAERKANRRRLVKKHVKKLVVSLEHLLFPSDVTCDFCKAELVCETRYNLCAECLESLPRTEGSKLCEVCGSPMDNEADYCLRCMNKAAAYSFNRSPLIYEGIAKDMILRMKFGGKRYFAKTLAPIMVDCYIENGMAADIVAFVPMTKKEKRSRGFNQAELLAKEVAKRLKLPVTNGLVKVRETKGQKSLGGKERAANLAGAFSALSDVFTKQAVLLVDDVFTTGATAEECALALKRAKAAKVLVLTAAVTKHKIYMA